jgi:hypothetical protein
MQQIEVYSLWYRSQSRKKHERGFLLETLSFMSSWQGSVFAMNGGMYSDLRIYW